ncbi:MAG: hypothetical protein Q7R44_00810 [bacterium]|nr:hypothetical protein [bacterium]
MADENKDQMEGLRNLHIPADTDIVKQVGQVAGDYIAQKDASSLASVPKHIREAEDVAKKAWRESYGKYRDTLQDQFQEEAPTQERKSMQQLYQQLKSIRLSLLQIIKIRGVDKSTLEERYWEPKDFPGGIRMQFIVGGKGENEIKTWWRREDNDKIKENIFSLKENGVSKYFVKIETKNKLGKNFVMENQQGRIGKNSVQNASLVVDETSKFVSALEFVLAS